MVVVRANTVRPYDVVDSGLSGTGDREGRPYDTVDSGLSGTKC